MNEILAWFIRSRGHSRVIDVASLNDLTPIQHLVTILLLNIDFSSWLLLVDFASAVMRLNGQFKDIQENVSEFLFMYNLHKLLKADCIF